MEKEPKNEKSTSIINRQEILGFIKDRNIEAEDFHLIEKLASFPKDMVIMELHNLFNMYRERSGGELDGMIQNTNDAPRKELLEAMRRFYQKYY